MDAHVMFANALASHWIDAVWSALWQSTLLAAALLLLTRLLKQAPASLRYWLWMLVPLRLLVMPLLSISLPVLPAAGPDAPYQAPVYAYSAASESAPAPRWDEPKIAPTVPAAAPVAPLERARTPLKWHTYALLAWAAGVLLLSLRMVRGWRWMHRLVKEGETLIDGPVVDAACKAATMLGLKKLPRLVVTDAPVSPFTCGVRRAVVVLPRAFTLQPDEPGLLAVLAHEAAHLRRYDSLFGILLGVCETLYFFHPVVHWVQRRILLEREKACDSLVLATSKARPSVYARAIYTAAQLAQNTRPPMSSPVLVAESFSDLKSRLTALASGATPPVKLSKASLAALVLLGAICVPGFVLTAAEPDASPSPALQPAPAVNLAMAAFAPQASTRTIHFPEDRALGTLSVCTGPIARRYKLGPDYDAVDRWETIGVAQGTVNVPADREVKLTLRGGALRQDLSALRELGPNDLQALDILCSQEDDILVDQAVMPFIGGLTGLKELEISAPALTDWGMQYIAGLTSLRDLKLRALRVTATGFQHLAGLQSLETLYTWTSLTDEGLPHVAKLPLLRELTINVSYIQGPGLEELAKLPALQFLELQGETFGDGGLRYLSALPTLKNLTLRGEGLQISDGGMRYVAQIPGLEELRLVRCEGISDAGVAQLVPLRSLRLLELHWAIISDAALASLSEMESLEELGLSNNPKSVVTDAGLAYLPRLKNLKRLEAMGTSVGPITDEGLASIATMTSLQELHVGGGDGITDAGIGRLAALPQLEVFALLTDSRAITDESLAHIGMMSRLRNLHLACYQAQFTTSGLNRLNALSQLEFLSVADAKHDDAVLNLSGLTRLRDVTIAMTPYKDEDLACLGGLTSLRRLQGINGIGDEGLAHLAGLTRLQMLNIHESHLTDDGLRSLANMKGLTCLIITGGFTGRAPEYLQALGSLQILGLSSNSALSEPEKDAALQAFEQLKTKLPNLSQVNLDQVPAAGYGG